MKTFTLVLFTIGFFNANFLHAATFNSNGTGGGLWTAAATWALISGADADGIPDSNDNITILGSDNVTWNTDIAVNSVTILGTFQLSGGIKTAAVYGNYTNNGIELGNGAVSFRGLSTCTISGSGTWSSNMKWTFSSGRTILAGTVITKINVTTFYNGSDVTNLGDMTIYTTSCVEPGSIWINGANSKLFLKSSGFMNGGSLNALASNNLVQTNYAFLTPIPVPVANSFYNLSVGSAGTTRLAANTIVLNNFTIGSNATFNSNGFDLSITGNLFLANICSFTQLAGDKITMNGSVLQNITNGSATATRTFESLVIDNPVGARFTGGGGGINILNSLAVLQGDLLIPASIVVTLVSNAATTAIIGTSNGTITGSMNIERFVDARIAGYSDMAGSIAGQTLADWDQELLLVYVYAPPSAYPSAYGYDETSWDYVPVTSSAEPLTAGVGFEVYLDSDGLQTTFNNTTIINTGTPNMGDVDMSGYVTLNNDGWNLVGNPYAANIDWDALQATTSDISTDFMFFDETIDDFATASTGAGELLAPNQGFWVNVTGGSPAFTFTETIKSTSNSSTFRHSTNPMFTLRLKSLGQTRFTSGTSFRFSETPENVTEGGSLPFHKLPHPDAPILCSKSNLGKDLKINLLNSSENTVVVPLKFNVGLSGIYTIEAQNLESVKTEGYSCVTLFDNKLNRTVEIANENYQFYAEVGENENRFTLTLSKSGDCQKSTDALSNTNEVIINRIDDNTLVKLNFENETSVSITITDLLGQKITPTQVLIATTQDVYLPLPTDFNGIYMVNVSYNNKTQSRKLYK